MTASTETREEPPRLASVLTSTWRALALPRRTGPLFLVLIAMLGAEWFASSTLLSLVLDAALFFLFVLLGPALYRALTPRGPWGQLAFVALSCAVVLGFVFPIFVLGRTPFTYVIDPGGTGILVMLFVVGSWGLGRDIDLEAHAVTSSKAASESALLAEQNALLAMRAQLDPHFLFNTLNAIAEWCREDPKVAEAATLKLATMLRTMLDGARVPSWSLEKELSLVRALTELYEIRDRGRYRFRLELPQPLPDVSVPPMLLLPLIENAITHGPAAGHPGEIVVRVRSGEAIEVLLENPGAFAGRREGGQGIAMAEKRLALAYQGRASLSVRAAGERTVTELSMPRRILEPGVT